jgi:hypothetical protein
LEVFEIKVIISFQEEIKNFIVPLKVELPRENSYSEKCHYHIDQNESVVYAIVAR